MPQQGSLHLCVEGDLVFVDKERVGHFLVEGGVILDGVGAVHPSRFDGECEVVDERQQEQQRIESLVVSDL